MLGALAATKADTRWPACAGHDRLRMITTATTHPHHEPDELAAIRQAVRALCEKFPGEYWRALDRERAYPAEFVGALTDAGFLAALIPEEYGGSGLTMSAAIAIMEEIQANGCNGAACHAQMYVMGTVLRHGSPEQKQKFLPAIARGELRLEAFGLAEQCDIERKSRETRLYQVTPISTSLILAYLAEHVLGLPRSY